MIRFDSVTMSYPGQARPALDDLTLEILRGEFVFLVGASGSGKSSFLRLILKEEKPTSGRIHVLGQDLRTIPSRKVPFFRRSLGVVFQDFRLLSDKNVHENVAFALRVIGKSRGYIQSAVPETLRLVGLDGKGKRMPNELSGGEQQRVAIARAIVNKPQVLLADEPTGNLDPVTSAGIMTLLERINAAGTTVVMATHEAGIVDQMQRRVIELSAGEVVRDERAAGYAVVGDSMAVGPVDGAVPIDRAAVALAAVEADGAAGVPAAAAAVEAQRADAEEAPDEAATTAAAATAAGKKTAGKNAGKKGAAKTGAAKKSGERTGAPAARPDDGEATEPRVAAAAAAAGTAADAEPAAGTVKVAAPKVTREVMRDAQPLYVEPEERDEVTDEAAEITAAATMPVEPLPEEDEGDAEADGPPGRPASPVRSSSAHLTLAERLGLRSPAGPRAADDDQEVGPVK
ncbi:cell division ATP-binding protein FtsE [Agromyces sp. SYSU T0242]|uniref:cell division ATP-binding protein FtsE n=1 Tax=Agromyces litoreus TaxID=3158561 RepID=UPI00339730A3